MGREGGYKSIGTGYQDRLGLFEMDVFGYANGNETGSGRFILISFTPGYTVPVMKLVVINAFLFAVFPLGFAGGFPPVNVP